MSNPTSNFGWQMPTPTDLVTDLPADFEVFGQAVDTSMADLKGGTAGQILSKNSNTDMDFIWIANDQGDITGVTATSPLTGGGTSGAITIGILDGTTSNKGAVQLSTSTSSTSTSFAATASAVKEAYDLANNGGPAFRAYRSTSSQTFSANTFTKVQLNTESFDTANCFDNTTNYRFTPNKAGYYQINANISANGAVSSEFAIQIRGNGITANQGGNTAISLLGYIGMTTSTVFYFNGTTDYVELWVYVGGGSPFLYSGSNGAETAMSGVWIRS